MITVDHIRNAYAVIDKIIHATPLELSDTFSTMTGQAVYLKMENLQKTGSFKVRGACHKIHALTSQQRARGVVAASAGNHAQGVAYASQRIGIRSTIVMPEGAALAKIQATEGYGAEVMLHGESFEEALKHAHQICEESGATFIHAFDDEKIITGQGTIGLEILEQLPDVDVIVCPIGGGGLIAGMATAIKELKPSVRIYGVEARACASMQASLAVDVPVTITSERTIADGIAIERPGALTLPLVQRYVDDVVTVDELEISRAMLYLLERSKLLIEGAGATPLAALLHDKIPKRHPGEKVVVILSGGNTDILFVSRVIQHGLIEAGRFVTITTLVTDRPGHLHRLLSIIAQLKANIISIQHQRISSEIVPGETGIELSLETRDSAHIEEIEAALKRAGYRFTKKL